MHARSRLDAVLNNLPNPRLTGTFFRSVNHNALHSRQPPDLLFSLGPGVEGQRFTQVGGPPALYLANGAQTAYAESTQSVVSSIAEIMVPPPMVVYAITVNLEHALDLNNPENLEQLGTSLAEIQGNWRGQMNSGLEVPTHILADAVFTSNRFQGMLYPSVAWTGGTDLIIWTDRVTDPSFIEVHDPSGDLARRLP